MGFIYPGARKDVYMFETLSPAPRSQQRGQDLRYPKFGLSLRRSHAFLFNMSSTRLSSITIQQVMSISPQVEQTMANWQLLGCPSGPCSKRVATKRRSPYCALASGTVLIAVDIAIPKNLLLYASWRRCWVQSGNFWQSLAHGQPVMDTSG